MTLRPFKIIYNSYKKRGPIYSIQTHRGDYLARDIKLGKKFFDKLLSYPITAFGYNIAFSQPHSDNQFNPKFDKFQVIKALDFWIEYFVYQNKCDYILENTVNKDFELHLEELIRVREAVLKEPADTKYVRQKIRPKTIMGVYPGHDGGKDFGTFTTFITDKDGLIEFTENVLDTSNSNLPFSTVDQFCYKVKTMTRKEYEEYNGRHVPTITRSSQLIADLIRVQSNLNFEENFRDDEIRWDFGTLRQDIQRAARFGDPEDEPSFTMWGAAHSDGGSVQERHPLNPDNWVIIPDRASEDTFKIVNSINGLNIATDFRTQEDARSYIEGIRNRGERSVPERMELFEIRGPDHTLNINMNAEPLFRTEPAHPSLPGSSSSALAGKRISRIDVRLRREGEPTGSIG